MIEGTPRDRLLEQERCGVCGLIHPFLVVCPFVEEREVRYEYALDGNGRRRTRFRVERTKYFPRPELFKAIEEATTGDDAVSAGNATSTATTPRGDRDSGRRAAGRGTSPGRARD